MDDFETPDTDDDQADSDLAEALMRLCPHLSSETSQQISIIVSGDAKLTVH